MTRTKKTTIPAVPISSAGLAGVLDISQRRVQQLVAEAVIPAPMDHKYDGLKCAMAYIKYQRKSSVPQGSGGTSTAELRRARAELLKAQKKNSDLAFRQKTGQLLPFDEVQVVVNAGTAVFTGQKRSMGSRLAGELAGMTDPKEILKRLNQENDRILESVSKELRSLADRANS